MHWGEKSCVETDRSLGREILCRNRQVTGERNLVSKQTGHWGEKSCVETDRVLDHTVQKNIENGQRRMKINLS